MARAKKVLNKNKVFYLMMFVLIMGVIGFTGYRAYNEFFKPKKGEETVVKKELDNLEMYGYTLDDLDTELYKSYFEELKSVLNEEEVDYNEYAKEIVKLFVTDFYTLNTKISSSDFGGLEFIHPDLIENFKLNAGDTIYNPIKTNLDGKREQTLPVVSEVSITDIEDTTYNYNSVEYEAYKVSANWSYESDLGYETSGTFYVIKEENKLYIVEK